MGGTGCLVVDYAVCCIGWICLYLERFHGTEGDNDPDYVSLGVGLFLCSFHYHGGLWVRRYRSSYYQGLTGYVRDKQTVGQCVKNVRECVKKESNLPTPKSPPCPRQSSSC